MGIGGYRGQANLVVSLDVQDDPIAGHGVDVADDVGDLLGHGVEFGFVGHVAAGQQRSAFRIEHHRQPAVRPAALDRLLHNVGEVADDLADDADLVLRLVLPSEFVHGLLANRLDEGREDGDLGVGDAAGPITRQRRTGTRKPLKRLGDGWTCASCLASIGPFPAVTLSSAVIFSVS